MHDRQLRGWILNATEGEIRELLGIVSALDGEDPDEAAGLTDWLLTWVRGGWDTIIDAPSTRVKGLATAPRVIGYYNAYLKGER